MYNERICPTCLSYMTNAKLEGWLKCPSCGFMRKESMSKITMDELLMGKIKLEELSEEHQENARELLRRLNLFREEFNKPMYVTSGYRSPETNNAVGGSKKSSHMTLQACDFRDTDGKLFEFIKKDPKILERCDLYLEDPQWTPSWVHLQSRPASQRIFIPYANKPALDTKRKI